MMRAIAAKLSSEKRSSITAEFWLGPFFRYSDYKDAVLAMVGDVIRLQFQGEPPPQPNQEDGGSKK